MILVLQKSEGDWSSSSRVRYLFMFPRCFIPGQSSSVRLPLHAYVWCLLPWVRNVTLETTGIAEINTKDSEKSCKNWKFENNLKVFRNVGKVLESLKKAFFFRLSKTFPPFHKTFKLLSWKGFKIITKNLQGVPHLCGFHYRGFHYCNFWLMRGSFC